MGMGDGYLVEDITAAIGLLLIGWGAWQFSPAIMGVSVGAILLTYAVVATLAKQNNPRADR